MGYGGREHHFAEIAQRRGVVRKVCGKCGNKIVQARRGKATIGNPILPLVPGDRLLQAAILNVSKKLNEDKLDLRRRRSASIFIHYQTSPEAASFALKPRL